MAQVIHTFFINGSSVVALDEDLPGGVLIGQEVRLNGNVAHVKGIPMTDPTPVYNSVYLDVVAEVGDELLFFDLGK